VINGIDHHAINGNGVGIDHMLTVDGALRQPTFNKVRVDMGAKAELDGPAHDTHRVGRDVTISEITAHERQPRLPIEYLGMGQKLQEVVPRERVAVFNVRQGLNA